MRILWAGILLLFAMLAGAAPAMAAAAAHGQAPAAHAPEPGAVVPEGPAEVVLPPIIAPMNVSGRLSGYAYITVAIHPVARDGILLIREKMPFLQDAFLRELNRGSILKVDDPKAVDEAAVNARLTERAKAVLPAGTVKDLAFQPIVIAPLVPQ